jgi:hypothetical protein
MPATSAVQACGRDCVTAVTSTELLGAADKLRTEGRDDAADVLLRGLFNDPSTDIRLEARFRYARSLRVRRRYADAIAQLDRILLERPSAAPVRVELATALELSGDHARSLREFARVQAGALPPDLAREIDQVVSTLRSSRPFGGSFEIGIAPDSNVNGATDARTIIIGGLPFELDRDARRRSGLGLGSSGQLFWRRPLAGETKLVVDATGRGVFYRDHDLNEGNLQISVGPEFADRLRPALFAARRWYLGRGYSSSYGANVQWLKPIARQTALDLSARVERVEVQRSALTDGTSYTASGAVEHAFRPTLFARVSVSANRYQARSPAFTTTSLGTGALIAKDLGRVSIYGQLAYSHLRADGLFLGERRREDRFDLGGGFSLRRFRILGASPVVRVTHVRSRSTVSLYDATRTRVEAALSRPL